MRIVALRARNKRGMTQDVNSFLLERIGPKVEECEREPHKLWRAIWYSPWGPSPCRTHATACETSWSYIPDGSAAAGEGSSSVSSRVDMGDHSDLPQLVRRISLWANQAAASGADGYRFESCRPTSRRRSVRAYRRRRPVPTSRRREQRATGRRQAAPAGSRPSGYAATSRCRGRWPHSRDFRQ